VLLAAWAVLTLADLAFVLTLGTNAPNGDEWESVPALVGREPPLPWLWQPHDGRRLPRAASLALFRLTHDFRAGMVVQVAVLSGLSLWLMRLAERLRGGPHWADLFFPASLLHTGHWENLLTGSRLGPALFAVLVTAVGVVALRTTRESAFRSGVAAGVLALLLATTGGFGLVAAVPVAAWVMYLAAVVRRTGPRWRAAVLAGLALLPVAYLGVYFVGYRPPARQPIPGEGGTAVVLTAGQVLAMALGDGVKNAWTAVLPALVLLGGATIESLRKDWQNPANRPAAAGLVAVAAGVVGVALAVGVGGDPGPWARYGLLAWPLLGLAYLVWVKRGSKWVPAALCTAAALAFPPNMFAGMASGGAVRLQLGKIEADAMLGLSPPRIVSQNLKGTGQEERAVRAIPMLREARVGAFAGSGTVEDSKLWRLAVVGGVVLAGFGLRWVWHLGRGVQVERARELFRLQHERFEQMLLLAAAETGKPRGLTWAGCEITGDAVLARDRGTRQIVAFVPVVVRFEPVAGGEMEEVPAAREPRPATAVFTFERGHWHTAGRVVFNHTPEQAVAAFGPQYAVLGHHH